MGTTLRLRTFGMSAGTILLTATGIGASKAAFAGTIDGTLAAASAPNEGIYDVVATSGDRYVGQSGDISARLAQHVAKGKITAAEASKAVRTYVPGGKTAREIAEQLAIDNYKRLGVKLSNVRNPIGDKRIGLMGPAYKRP